MLYERPVLVLFNGQLQLFIAVHQDRTIPGYHLADGFARDRQEPDRFFCGRNCNVIAVSITADRAVHGSGPFSGAERFLFL